MDNRRKRALVGAALASCAVGCGIGVRRDLSETKPQVVIYDDLCGLQDYFDGLEAGKLQPPRLVMAKDLEKEENGKIVGGRRAYAFETEYQVKQVKRLLEQNWKRLPPEVEKAKAITIEARWAHKAGIERVVTNEDAELAVGKETWGLPYHVCLSELLFGAPLYKTRRAMLGLPDPQPIPAPTPAPAAPPQTTTAPADPGAAAAPLPAASAASAAPAP
jgi:hypothetical protein